MKPPPPTAGVQHSEKAAETTSLVDGSQCDSLKAELLKSRKAVKVLTGSLAAEVSRYQISFCCATKQDFCITQLLIILFKACERDRISGHDVPGGTAETKVS